MWFGGAQGEGPGGGGGAGVVVGVDGGLRGWKDAVMKVCAGGIEWFGLEDVNTIAHIFYRRRSISNSNTRRYI